MIQPCLKANLRLATKVINVCTHTKKRWRCEETLLMSYRPAKNGESMKHAHPLLCLLVSICFTSMFKHCYMLQSMIDSVIIPIIKNKSGDFNDKNNYRPIAQSSIISKVFEQTIVIRLEDYLWTNGNQFGFKSGHSTDLCY